MAAFIVVLTPLFCIKHTNMMKYPYCSTSMHFLFNNIMITVIQNKIQAPLYPTVVNYLN